MKVFSVLLIIAAFVLSGCGKSSPGEMNAKAEEAYKLQNYPLALEQFTELITVHPGSSEAEDAAFRCGAIYQNDLHDSQKAVDAYNRYLSLFPQGKKAPTALFLLGYMYNNELHKLDSAAIAYRAFLSKYPNDEMASSAKFELENLGKPAEALLPPTVASDQPGKKSLERGKN